MNGWNHRSSSPGFCDSSQKIQASRNRWREEVNNQASRIRARNETQKHHYHHQKEERHNNREVDELSTMDHVVTNANSSQGEAQLYIFEDNEAEIKMIMKSRSPTMRHVSRTHKVALDWLFDRVNLDPPKSKSNMFTPKTNLRTC